MKQGRFHRAEYTGSQVGCTLHEPCTTCGRVAVGTLQSGRRSRRRLARRCRRRVGCGPRRTESSPARPVEATVPAQVEDLARPVNGLRVSESTCVGRSWRERHPPASTGAPSRSSSGLDSGSTAVTQATPPPISRVAQWLHANVRNPGFPGRGRRHIIDGHRPGEPTTGLCLTTAATGRSTGGDTLEHSAMHPCRGPLTNPGPASAGD